MTTKTQTPKEAQDLIGMAVGRIDGHMGTIGIVEYVHEDANTGMWLAYIGQRQVRMRTSEESLPHGGGVHMRAGSLSGLRFRLAEMAKEAAAIRSW